MPSICRQVLPEQYEQFITAGWEASDNRGDLVFLHNTGINTTDGVVCPSLIQEGRIRRPLGHFANDHSLLMGSFELETVGNVALDFGAARCFMYDLARHPTRNLHSSETIKRRVGDHTFRLRIYSRYEGNDLLNYEAMLLSLYEGRSATPELLRFGPVPNQNADVWLDYENLAIFSFDKNYMNRVEPMLNNSYAQLTRNSAA